MKKLSTLNEITELQKQICDGALLGDGSYILHKNAINAYFSYASKYIAVSNYIFSLLQSFGGKVQVNTVFDKRTNKSYTTTQYKSYTNALITKEYLRWYNFGHKHLPTDLVLTPIVCLWWYIGDGCLCRCKDSISEIKLATHSFIKDEQEQILLPQLAMFGAKLRKADINKNTGKPQFAIYIPRKFIKAFLDYIGPCPIREYQYKWQYIDYKNKEPESHKALEPVIISKYLENKLNTYYAIATTLNIAPKVVQYYLQKNNLYDEYLKIHHNINLVIQYNNSIPIYIFKTISQAIIFNNLPTSASGCISQVCNNKRKTAYGYSWKYYNNLSDDDKLEIQNLFKKELNTLWEEIR